MFILLTDLLRCPRCGPDFGLILLADQVQERRVLEGRLGCPNCREQYPVRGGVLDLRTGPSPAANDAPAALGDRQEGAIRIAALLGLAEPGGTVLLAGPGADLAPDVAPLAPGTEFLAVVPRPGMAEEREGVSRVVAGPGLPFAGRSLRAAALTGGADGALLREAARVIAPGGRLLVEEAGAGTAEAVREAGVELLLEQDGTVLGRVPAGPGRPR